MAAPPRPTIETRYDQMFPRLSPAEIDRLRPFGEVRSYGAGERLVTTGQVSPGMFVIVGGEVAVSQHSVLGRDQPIVTHGPGSFMGELAQLSGRPALVDARAETAVDALVLPPPRLREALVAEAELGERIMRALILRRVGLLESGAGGPVIVGRAGDGDVLRLAGFLRRSGHPYHHLDPDVDASARTLLDGFHLDASDLPIVLCASGSLLRNPPEDELASCLGLVRPIDPDRVHDVAIVGAGPAGLAAAVYGASEGLSVIVLDARAFGGQAGASARIENYLGFPTGISGMALMARAYNQAQKFGAEMAIPDEAVRLERAREGDRARFRVALANGERVLARAVIIASGARYRRLAVPDLAAFEGTGVHYWASPLEAGLCAAQEVALVGAGNSAGQAAVYLSTVAAKVWMLVRGPGLGATMSRYLVDRIAALRNVEVRLRTEVVALEGRRGALEAVRWRDAAGEESRRALRHLFLFIGADPNTSWLGGSDVALDPKGFVRTGAEAGRGRGPLETSVDGVFAIGDVRAGSTKRVAAAVGEGAQVIAAIHAHLSRAGERLDPAQGSGTSPA
ncbi:MAG TPA: FAD-dependent oxidoreductase [Anaeromyxobacteraceae bacterium]|nr:FAD-dependent oxidoreductase [Anaeromyxobacteraceae bacterium]